MPNPASKSATYADIEALPAHLIGEIINGTLVTQPRPVRRHTGAATALGALVPGAYQFGIGGPGGWVFANEAELHLGPHVLVADIAGWKMERMTESPEEPYFHIAPDWVFEAMSPSTEKYDRNEKRTIYAHHGVGYLWYLDPRLKMLETFQKAEKQWLLTGTFTDDANVCAPPFEDLTFSLGKLWPFDRLGERPA
jgi:Uma2 family endonuclease